LGQGFAPRIGSLRPGNENPKAYRPAIMKLPMVTIGAHRLTALRAVFPFVLFVSFVVNCFPALQRFQKLNEIFQISI